MLIVYTNHYPVKGLSLLVQQLNLTLGEKEPLKSVAGELKGLKGAEDVKQLKRQPIYCNCNYLILLSTPLRAFQG